MNTDPTARTQRSGAVTLLQILGAFSIVAFHVGIPFSQSAWIVVEIFFVLAGINMSSLCESERSVVGFARIRACRFLPEVGTVWAISLFLVLLGHGSAGTIWFTATAPFFAQNLFISFFDYTMPQDWLFIPLWFIAALLQLQLAVFATRRWWLKASPTKVLLATVGLGTSLRALFALLVDGNVRTLTDSTASALYCLPIAHAEALVLGVMLGRGALAGIGRLLPVAIVSMIALGALNIWLGHGEVTAGSGGYMFPMRLNYIHVWGYTVLAFTAASLCAKDGSLARFTNRVQRVPWLDRGLGRLGSLTFGIYVFHGIVMATGINGSAWLNKDSAPVLRLLLFVITLAEAVLLAWTFAWCRSVVLPILIRRRPSAARNPRESRVPT